jgi:hypothetical protein
MTPHAVRTVELPSGQTLEAVYPEHGSPYTRLRRAADRDLSICWECRSRLVEPTSWKSAGPTSWRLDLWCPDCLHARQEVVTAEAADRFDEHLDGVMTRMFAALGRFEQERMREACERFIGALTAGAIVPEDFERGSR